MGREGFSLSRPVALSRRPFVLHAANLFNSLCEAERHPEQIEELRRDLFLEQSVVPDVLVSFRSLQ